MYNEQLEQLIDAALTDGVLTEKEKQVLFKKAQALGVDLDEFEMVLDARLVKLKQDAEEKARTSAPKSNKYGDVKKCPACGAIVPQLTGFCEECGYEFSNVGVTLFSQTLADKIEEIRKETARKKSDMRISGLYSSSKQEGEFESPLEKVLRGIDREEDDRIDSLVESFPIPNSKSELYDFISFLRVEGYSKKLDESLKKAMQLFPNDEMFQKIASEVREKEKRSDRNAAIGCCVSAIIFLLIIFLGWYFGFFTLTDIINLIKNNS